MLNGIATWAVMIFVWIAGIELDLKSAWKSRRETGLTAGAALLTPLLLGCAAAILLLQSGEGWQGPGAETWQFVLGIGMACAVTALPILVLFMEKLGILRLPLGQRILRYASLDDLAIWAVLALILLDWERVGRQAAFLILFAGVAWGVRWLMLRIPPQDRWYAGLIWMAAAALVSDWAGLHYMVGAFLAGAVLDRATFEDGQMDLFRNHILFAIMPVFFLSTGLRTEWSVGGSAVFGAAALLLVASVAGKLAGVKLAGLALGWRKGEASLIGWLLQTKALIMIIFANILLDRGVITSDAFTALLLMAAASTMLTIPFAAPILRKTDAARAKAAEE
jgi:Kef-type K+ transport system membrane component KefB